MIALDTNIIVRFLVRDDERQAQAVYARFKRAEQARETLFVPLLVVLETIWVLESAYDKSRAEILEAFDELKGLSILKFEKDAAFHKFLSVATTNHVDLSDVLIACSAEATGSESGLTFDRRAAKLPFFDLLK